MSSQTIHSASFLNYPDFSSGRDGVLGTEDRDLSPMKQQHHLGLREVMQEPGRVREEESEIVK